MEERGLEYRKLLDVPCNVNLSKNHPLAQDPDFKLEKLKDYPFVEYAIEGDRGSPYNRISQVSFINLSKLFRVSSGNSGPGLSLPPTLTVWASPCLHPGQKNTAYAVSPFLGLPWSSAASAGPGSQCRLRSRCLWSF